MPALIESRTPATPVRAGVERRILHTERLMTVVIDFLNGPWDAPEPPHQHVHEQTSVLVSGEVLFFIEGEEPHHLHPGDMVAIPPEVPHTIQLLSPTARLVDSFTPIRGDFLV